MKIETREVKGMGYDGFCSYVMFVNFVISKEEERIRTDELEHEDELHVVQL